MTTSPYHLDGEIAVITFDNPPMNGFSHALRKKIVTGIEHADADPAVKAVILIGSGTLFSSGADIKEFGKPAMLAEPNLRTVIAVVESSTKPVIAAIAGICMGGGLELALGCNYRVVAPKTQIALPEVKLGLLPGAGGTQRLPRLIGLEYAMNIIVSGEPVQSDQFKGSPLFDEFIEGDLLEGALAFARKVVAEKMPLKRVRDLKVRHPKPDAYINWVKTVVGQMTKNYPAPLACIEAVANSLTMKFEDGLKAERVGFSTLFMGEEHRALRHLFFAERAACQDRRRARGHGHSTRSRASASSAPARWAPASASTSSTPASR